jgi:demethylmacrocin O-methyltransferase
MTELCELAKKYLSDKCPQIFHSYTPEYHRLLNHFCDKEITVLEIGIGNYDLMAPIVGQNYVHGASLKMWRDYFPKGNIIGCDILESVLFSDERIETYQLDQSNIDSLEQLSTKINDLDIIIDDGSHIEEHMYTSFSILWKKIKVGGIYIIEDIRAVSLESFKNIAKFYRFNDAELIYAHEGNNYWDSFVAFRKTTQTPI